MASPTLEKLRRPTLARPNSARHPVAFRALRPTRHGLSQFVILDGKRHGKPSDHGRQVIVEIVAP